MRNSITALLICSLLILGCAQSPSDWKQSAKVDFFQLRDKVELAATNFLGTPAKMKFLKTNEEYGSDHFDLHYSDTGGRLSVQILQNPISGISYPDNVVTVIYGKRIQYHENSPADPDSTGGAMLCDNAHYQINFGVSQAAVNSSISEKEKVFLKELIASCPD